jgi:hypothetical protein
VSIEKITASHRARQAIIYVRQSTLEQVATNLESQRRQYGLAERAVDLGWPRTDVVVIDDDLGVSGGGPGWATAQVYATRGQSVASFEQRL